MRVHAFHRDDETGPDHRGDYRCWCGLPKDNVVHEVPEVSAEARELEDRRLGEARPVDAWRGAAGSGMAERG